MNISYPDYYHQFRCLAGACPDSCCQEWDVQVDEASAKKYLQLEGELGQSIRQHLKQDEDGYYLQITDRRCPMWQQDGLCRIQAEMGEDGLCHVCAEFPRLRHDYGDFAELGLELSCPEAARLMLTAKSAPWVTCEEGACGEGEYDPECMQILLRTRQQALRIVETWPFPEAMTLLLLYGYRVQEELDGGEPACFDPQEELILARKMAGRWDWKLLRQFYAGLEILTPRWRELLDHPNTTCEIRKELSAMARCCIERYYLQAVSDWDLICRIKMIVSACLLVHHLGGNPIETAQLYSKEIDNSIDNIETILDAAYTNPALTDQHLLSLIASIQK